MRSVKKLRRRAAVVILSLALVATACWKVDADLELSTHEINFGTAMNEATVTVTNDSRDKALTSGVTELDYQFKSDRAWITIVPVSGRLGGEESVTHTISIDRSALADGPNAGTITVTSNGGNETIIVSALRTSGTCSGAPSAPSDPTPDNASTGVSLTTRLSWLGGESQCDGLAATYDVYFGNTTSPPFHHNNASSKSWDPDPLQANTLYYWRVVAKDANGSTSGATWSFRTASIIACTEKPDDLQSLSPANGADNVSLGQDLSWSGGDSQCAGLTATYDVYFGASSPPPFDHNNGEEKHWDPGTLADNRTYYWRIVAKDGNGSTSSSEMSFHTLTCENNLSTPCSPSPSNGKQNVNTKTNLSWGCGADYEDECSDEDVSYVVYFGTGATLGEADRQGTTTSRSYNLDTLAGHTTYYWKVVVQTPEASMAGPVWSFTTR